MKDKELNEIIRCISAQFIETMDQNNNEIPDYFERAALKDFLIQIYQKAGGSKVKYKAEFSWSALLDAQKEEIE
jgi:hypothetical protein